MRYKVEIKAVDPNRQIVRYHGHSGSSLISTLITLLYEIPGTTREITIHLTEMDEKE